MPSDLEQGHGFRHSEQRENHLLQTATFQPSSLRKILESVCLVGSCGERNLGRERQQEGGLPWQGLCRKHSRKQSWTGRLHPPAFWQVQAGFPRDQPKQGVSAWEVTLVVLRNGDNSQGPHSEYNTWVSCCVNKGCNAIDWDGGSENREQKVTERHSVGSSRCVGCPPVDWAHSEAEGDCHGPQTLDLKNEREAWGPRIPGKKRQDEWVQELLSLRYLWKQHVPVSEGGVECGSAAREGGLCEMGTFGKGRWCFEK